jgi:peptide-methionine (S)-S-oxide reductase
MPKRLTILAGVLMLAVSMAEFRQVQRKDGMQEQNPLDAVHSDPNDPNTLEATFAAGCFWGVEHFFAAVPGVVFTEVGYTGGKVKRPTYQQVCSGRTGHAEAVHLRYDPNQISYETLVRLFFKMHDPTTPNRQGPDIGTQYRSAIFVHSDEQKQTAEAVIRDLAARRAFKQRIVTRIVSAAPFWRAEAYHQQYFKKNPERSCHTQFCPTMLQ